MLFTLLYLHAMNFNVKAEWSAATKMVDGERVCQVYLNIGCGLIGTQVCGNIYLDLADSDQLHDQYLEAMAQVGIQTILKIWAD